MYCDFSAVTDILFDHLSGTSIGNYTGIIEVLFSSYLKKPDNSLEKQEVSKYRNRKRKLPTNLVEHYIKTDKQKLLSDISVLLTYQFDRADLHKSLFLLMCNDEYLSIEYRKRIKREYSSTYSDDKALSELIYEAVYTAVARPYTLENGLYYVRSYFNADLLESSDTLFINAKPLEPCKFFCGRDEELEELHKKVHKKGKVVVTGVIGVGKSELVRAYAKKYASDYKQVIYCLIDDSQNDCGIKPAISKLITSPFDSFDKKNNYDINLNLLSSLGENALLIFDNYNISATDDDALSDILQLECDVIFTSRMHYDDIPVYLLKTFRRYVYGYSLLRGYYPFNDDDPIKDEMHSLISITKGHPYSLDLCGRQLKKGLQTPQSMRRNLADGNGKNINTRISTKKDGTFIKGTYHQLIYKIFYSRDLNDTEWYLLSYLRFAPEDGISKTLFAYITGVDDLNIIEDLIECGFIYEFENGTIILPAMIMEIVTEEKEIVKEEFVPFFKKILSCDLSYGSKDMLYTLANNCTCNDYTSFYNEDKFMACHDIFQFYHKIDNYGAMNMSLVLLIVLHDRKDRKKAKIYKKDKEQYYRSISSVYDKKECGRVMCLLEHIEYSHGKRDSEPDGMDELIEYNNSHYDSEKEQELWEKWDNEDNWLSTI